MHGTTATRRPKSVREPAVLNVLQRVDRWGKRSILLAAIMIATIAMVMRPSPGVAPNPYALLFLPVTVTCVGLVLTPAMTVVFFSMFPRAWFRWVLGPTLLACGLLLAGDALTPGRLPGWTGWLAACVFVPASVIFRARGPRLVGVEIARARADKREPPCGVCEACGYNLTGITRADACPECGHTNLLRCGACGALVAENLAERWCPECGARFAKPRPRCPTCVVDLARRGDRLVCPVCDLSVPVPDADPHAA